MVRQIMHIVSYYVHVSGESILQILIIMVVAPELGGRARMSRQQVIAVEKTVIQAKACLLRRQVDV